MSIADEPIGPEQLDGLFAPLIPEPGEARVALAVSGGSDSTALMVLFVDWLVQTGRPACACTVLTVDHRLRPESPAEAQAVASQATALGFRHATLVWEGEKPQAGIQAAAREARYRLMREHMRAHNVAMLLTGHTLDDQAETLLMRLARGSGLDGLSAMASCVLLGHPETHAIEIARPLLGVPKARLRATLERRGISWFEDPGNQSLDFERSRLRAARAQLAAAGLTGDMLALSARRLRRARAALDASVEEHCSEAKGVVRTDACGFFSIERQSLCRTPEEVALRVFARCIAAAGGLPGPVPMGKLEPIVDALRGEHVTPSSWTLSRALISAGPRAVQIEREPGREPLPRLALAAGNTALWDGRFVVGVREAFEGKVEVHALAGEGLGELRRMGQAVTETRPLRLAASFWQASRLLAVPAVGFWASADLQGQLGARFLGLQCNSRPPGPGGAGKPPLS